MLIGINALYNYFFNPFKPKPISPEKNSLQCFLPNQIQCNESKERSIENINEMAASWSGFLSKILIERTFFQNSGIPQETILYLANDLIRILTPRQQETISVTKEMIILWKQLKGQPLTQEEEIYENSIKSIDVLGEILNGITLSTTALLGQNLVLSLKSAMAQNLWSHIPAIVGYSSTVLMGYRGINFAVEHLLDRIELSSEQKKLLKPWFNMLGKLILGFSPKVHATEKGVHYHYPSTEGFTQTYSQGQVATAKGDALEIEQEGIFETPEGNFTSLYTATFKLHAIDEINGERIQFQVKDQHGMYVPVQFTIHKGKYGPEIQVICENEAIADHWKKLIIHKHDTPNCAVSLAVGGVGSITMQNTFPLAIAALACLPIVSTQESKSALHDKKIDLNKPSTFLRNKITYQQALERLGILEEKEEPLSDEDQREYSELEKIITPSGCQVDSIEIYRNDRAKYYTVECRKSAAVALVENFEIIENRVSILLTDQSLNLAKKLYSDSFSFAQSLRNVENTFGTEFFYSLRFSYIGNLNLLLALGYLTRYPNIFNKVTDLIAQSDSLSLMQKDFIRNSNNHLTNYIQVAQNILKKIVGQINDAAIQGPNGKTFGTFKEHQLAAIKGMAATETDSAIKLITEINTDFSKFSDKVTVLKNNIQSTISDITANSESIKKLMQELERLETEKIQLEDLMQKADQAEEDWYKKKQKEIDSTQIITHRRKFLRWTYASWTEVKREDFKSEEARQYFLEVRKKADDLLNKRNECKRNLANEIAKHIGAGSNQYDTDLEEASRELAGSIVNVQELEKSINRKIQQLKNQAEHIKDQPTNSNFDLNNVEEANAFLDEITNRILSFRYAIYGSEFQIKGLDIIAGEEQKYREIIADEIRKGTFKTGQLVKEIERLKSDSNALQLPKEITDGLNPKEEKEIVKKETAPEGKIDL